VITVLPSFGGPLDAMSIALETKAKHYIRNSRKQLPRPRQALEVAATFHTGNGGGPVKLRSLTDEYNCYGMLFAARRTHIHFPEDVEALLVDDGYRIIGRADALVGDLVLYRNKADDELSHAALIIRISTNILRATRTFHLLSQWGDDGEYFHGEDELPPHLTIRPYRIEYRTERA
jgi:hypothetical protein